MHPIDLALQIAINGHKGQIDKSGYPVILHPLAVGLMGHTDEEKATGFLHDVVEDTDITIEQLQAYGLPIGIVKAVDILTHREGITYSDYIQNIISSANPIALQVKYNDLQHNYSRDEEGSETKGKHAKALEQIKAAIDACSIVDLYHAPCDPDIDVAIFACGCFWGAQHQFDKEPGVKRTLAGYTGGEEEKPSYADVRDHKTHHVEAVIVEFDPRITSYTQLCKVFFEIHDPAQTDGVGPDLGPQYRSCLFYRNQQQLDEAQAVANILRAKGDEVNTLFLPEAKFYIGEEYHQRYYEKTGGEPYCHMRVKKF